MQFALIGSRLYETAYELRNDIEEVHKRLAYEVDGFWEANDRALEALGGRS